MEEAIGGKTALVTGGAKRIGASICLRLAQQGVHVAFSYRSSRQEASHTREGIQSQGVQGLAIEADLSRLDECERLVGQVQETLGQVDILVNNASIFPKTRLVDFLGQREFFEGQFDQLYRLHMKAPLFLGMHLGLKMKEQGWGRIVNITDRVVSRGQAYPHWALYLATKYGLYGLTQALAVELSPEVTVNSIAPGLVIPPPDFSESEVERLRQRIPLRREASPQEIAEDVLHLIRSQAKTGSVVVTDGGSGLGTF